MAKGKFNLFGGLFDFNRNGKTEPWELWIANQMLKASIKDDSDVQTDDICFEDEDSDISFPEQCDDMESPLSEKYEWRQNCPDGSEYDISPDDFEEESDYLEALEEAKYEWREYCPDGTEYGISPEDYETEEEYMEALIVAEDAAFSLVISPALSVECESGDTDTSVEIKETDYPNKRTYLAAHELASAGNENNNSDIVDRCTFILDNPNLVAAKYYSVGYGFLYAQAVKENFEIPVDFPDEDEYAKTNFFDIIKEISEFNIPLSLEIWSWCIDNFMPYIKYAYGFGEKLLTCTIIEHIYEMPEGFSDELIQYLSENSEFSKKVIRYAPEISQNIYVLLHQTILRRDSQAAIVIFTDVLNNEKADVHTIFGVIDTLVYCCKTWKETETIITLKEYLIPILKTFGNPKYVEYTVKLEDEIDSYCHTVEQQIQTEKDICRKKSQLNILVNSMKDIITRIEQGDIWEPFDENTPEYIAYDFIYPNGKNGDIDMFIASKYGQVDKLDELHYSALLPTAYKEEIVLLAYIYTHAPLDDISRNELDRFLYDYNLGHRLRQYCDTYLTLGGDTLGYNETEEESAHWLKIRYGNESEEEISLRLYYAKIRSNAMEIANRYMETVRQKRNKVYDEIVRQGLTSSRWASEQKAYLIVKNIYPDAIFQYRDDWLGFQSLDIYIPSKKIAIEYQGKQHYEKIDFFGGEEKFIQNQIRDENKRKKCIENGVRLIEWRYDAPLTEEYIVDMISRVDSSDAD